MTTAEERGGRCEISSRRYDFIKLTIAVAPELRSGDRRSKATGIRVVGPLICGSACGARSPPGSRSTPRFVHGGGLKDDAPMKVSVSDAGVWRKPNWESLDYVDDRKVVEIARATVEAGVYTCPTLTFFKMSFAVEQSDDEIRARPDFRFYPEPMREPLLAAHRRFWTGPPTPARRQTYVRVRNQLVKSIHDAGGKIMAGSDTPELFLLYGFTLHRELRSLVEAASAITPRSPPRRARRRVPQRLRQLWHRRKGKARRPRAARRQPARRHY